jgi:hypothetical protein
MMSGLADNRWAVISERGREATGLSHEDARRLVHRLAGEGRHGLCIVTDEAASRMGTAGPTQQRPTSVTELKKV